MHTFSTSCFELASGIDPFRSCILYHFFAFCSPITALAARAPDTTAVRPKESLGESCIHDDIVHSTAWEFVQTHAWFMHVK